MGISFLLKLDRLFGPILLWILAPIVWLVSLFLPKSPGSRSAFLSEETTSCVFLKLKGGGSLIIALPSLLAMRKSAPNAKFTLVCTMETKVYAELTGIFDHYALVSDETAFSLINSAIEALKKCFHADVCIDLEPNSLLSSVFALLTTSAQRIGLVKPQDKFRSLAYTSGISFNIYAPIYLYYDQMAELLAKKSATLPDSKAKLLLQIRKKTKNTEIFTICLAPFTSDFARERRMPIKVWGHFLEERFKNERVNLILVGSAKDKSEALKYISELRTFLPLATITEKCGQSTLDETTADLLVSDEVWSIDSGLLHIARLLGIKCTSFWGPTNPVQRLRKMENLDEAAHYNAFVCSPCTHIIGKLPCGGNNLCMKTMAEKAPNKAPLWYV